MPSAKKTLPVSVPADFYRDLQRFAAEETLRRGRRVTMSGVVREAVAGLVKRRRAQAEAAEDRYLHDLANKAEAEGGRPIPLEQVAAELRAAR